MDDAGYGPEDMENSSEEDFESEEKDDNSDEGKETEMQWL